MTENKNDQNNANSAVGPRESRLLKVIRERKSVRNFDPNRPVEEEKLRTILEAARLAPSSNNTQPWHFVVVRDEKTRDMIAGAAPLGAATNKWMRLAPVIIVCCGKEDVLYHKSAGRLFDKDFFKIDIAIAVEHIVLTAKELGLGTCWAGWFDERKIKNILRIPSGTHVIALLPVGYPKGAWPAAKKRKSMDEIVSFEKFGNKTP